MFFFFIESLDQGFLKLRPQNMIISLWGTPFLKYKYCAWKYQILTINDK